MNTYETIYISPSELPQEKIEASLEKVKRVITRAAGKIVTAELWGRRRLSYPIKRNRDGFYSYLIFSAPNETPALLDRHFRVTETILRGLTVKVDPRHLEKIRSPVRAATSETTPGTGGAGPQTEGLPGAQTAPDAGQEPLSKDGALSSPSAEQTA